MKVKDSLLNYKNMIIYQDDDWFKLSMDSVLLANFVTINMGVKKIIDFATGNAPIPMLLSYRTNAEIYGIEYQKCIYELGIESLKENRLDKKIKLINGDVKDIKNLFKSEFFDVVTCNPPYFKKCDSSHLNENEVKAIARHEVCLCLEDVVKNASYVLKNRGILAMVHRTERMIEIIEMMKKYRLEPKRIQFIYPKVGRDSDLFLIEGVKNGNVGLKMLSPIILHNDGDDNYTDEIKELFSIDS